MSERYTLEVPDKPFSEKDRDRPIWKTHHREPRDDEEFTNFTRAMLCTMKNEKEEDTW